jgi:hypothetical protein
LSKRIFTGLQPRRLGRLVADLADAWMIAEESRLRDRRAHERLRAPGAGPDHDLPFTDRVIVTLVYLRCQLPHAAIAALCQVDRSTVTRAVREIRPLLAARGFAVPHHPGLRLRTLADVFAYASARGVELRIDGTEVQVRRPKAGRPGRKALVSGKKKMNTKKATVVTDEQGAPCGPGRSAPAACTTRPRSAPRELRTCSPSSPRSRPVRSVRAGRQAVVPYADKGAIYGIGDICRGDTQ